jgi:lipopolysaccharide transport system ATP-binding protein
MSTVISVENLSKRYIIGHQKQERYTSLRDVLTDGTKRFTHKLIHPFATQEIDSKHEEFWALKDVSFDIQQGDRVGVIGRNGAGKSTLLKILSRITEPTSGRVSINGRVASLLEVGTGFHPELSGRENIFLNGAILGMSKKEIKSKFDEIVAFAEVEKFLDTPVKRYSSGMYVRLAFAVAAHLEPEILIVDEVLAVGDAQFQTKCMGKMESVGREGRTVLFVSHNMDAVGKLCNKGILLDQGRVATQGGIDNVIKNYLESSDAKEYSIDTCERTRKGGIEIQDVWLSDDKGNLVETIFSNSVVHINLRIKFDIDSLNRKIDIGFGVDTLDGRRLFTTLASWINAEIIPSTSNVVVKCKLQELPLVQNKYLLSAAAIHPGHAWDYAFHCASFEVLNKPSDHYYKVAKNQGDFFVPFEFESTPSK